MKWILRLSPIPFFLLAACGPGKPKGTVPAAENTPPPLIYTGNHPLQFFVQTIAGDAVDVRLPFPDDIDPAEWEPEDTDILALQEADLIILNGAGYEGWLDTVVLEAERLIDTAAGFRDRWIEEEEFTHTHGPWGEHTHGGTAFTTWLDPQLAIEQVRAVTAALQDLLPGHSDRLAANAQSLIAELEELDQRLEAAFAEAPGTPLLASHPVYQYLERRYQLNLVSVHWEPDEHPDDAEWNALARTLEVHPARAMLWEDEPLPETATRLDLLDVQVVVFNPGSQPPEEGNFLSLMHRNAGEVERFLRYRRNR